MTEQQLEPPLPPSGGSNKKWIALAVGGGCVLIACLGLVVALVVGVLMPKGSGPWTRLFPAVNPQPTEFDGTYPGGSSAYPQQYGNTLGDPNAPVKMLVYSDFQCPYCLHYSQDTEPQVIDAYVKTGKVFYEYRSVGAFIGPESAAAAQAAYCAGDQGKFWEYHAALFSHWTGENAGDFTQGKLLQYATPLGIDPTVFYECVNSGKYAERVKQDAKDAEADGVQATPSFLVNGKLIEGAQPFDVFQQAIDDALQGK